MIQVCQTCRIQYGQKEPLEDRSVTHGLCKPCCETEMFKSAAEIVAKLLARESCWMQRMRLMRKFIGVACTVWEMRGFLPKGAGRVAGGPAHV